MRSIGPTVAQRQSFAAPVSAEQLARLLVEVAHDGVAADDQTVGVVGFMLAVIDDAATVLRSDVARAAPASLLRLQHFYPYQLLRALCADEEAGLGCARLVMAVLETRDCSTASIDVVVTLQVCQQRYPSATPALPQLYFDTYRTLTMLPTPPAFSTWTPSQSCSTCVQRCRRLSLAVCWSSNPSCWIFCRAESRPRTSATRRTHEYPGDWAWPGWRRPGHSWRAGGWWPKRVRNGWRTHRVAVVCSGCAWRYATRSLVTIYCT